MRQRWVEDQGVIQVEDKVVRPDVAGGGAGVGVEHPEDVQGVEGGVAGHPAACRAGRK